MPYLLVLPLHLEHSLPRYIRLGRLTRLLRFCIWFSMAIYLQLFSLSSIYLIKYIINIIHVHIWINVVFRDLLNILAICQWLTPRPLFTTCLTTWDLGCRNWLLWFWCTTIADIRSFNIILDHLLLFYTIGRICIHCFRLWKLVLHSTWKLLNINLISLWAGNILDNFIRFVLVHLSRVDASNVIILKIVSVSSRGCSLSL